MHIEFSQMAPMKTTTGLLLSLAMLVFCGCGDHPPYSCVRVSGKVTYENGALIPADQINLIFIPQTPAIDPKVPPRNGHADVDTKTGTFDFATTFVRKDGIISGESKVVVQCIRQGKLVHDLIADEYTQQDKTPLTVNTNESPLTIKLSKQL
jgi:hypothetical protein